MTHYFNAALWDYGCEVKPTIDPHLMSFVDTSNL